VFVLSYVQVAALRRADPQSKESYLLLKIKKTEKAAKVQQRAVEPQTDCLSDINNFGVRRSREELGSLGAERRVGCDTEAVAREPLGVQYRSLEKICEQVKFMNFSFKFQLINVSVKYFVCKERL
jgi:hypothetical protein